MPPVGERPTGPSAAREGDPRFPSRGAHLGEVGIPLTDVAFDVPRGLIVAWRESRGTPWKELAEALAGLIETEAGEVHIDGEGCIRPSRGRAHRRGDEPTCRRTG